MAKMVPRPTTSSNKTIRGTLLTGIAILAVAATSIVCLFGPQNLEAECRSPINSNQLLICLSSVNPHIAGFRLEDKDASKITLLRTHQEEPRISDATLLTSINSLTGRSFESTETVVVKYSARQLLKWFSDVTSDPGVWITAVDLDEATSTIMVFTPDSDPRVEPRILAHTRELGIPSDAVQITRYAEEEITDILEFQEIGSKRTDRRLVPLTGGVRIQSADGRNSSACSIGLLASYGESSTGGKEGFFTARHCGSYDSLYAYGNQGQRYTISVESLPAPPGGPDVQFVETIGEDEDALAIGYITRPSRTRGASSRRNLEGRTPGPATPYFVVSGAEVSLMGDRVEKVGFSSGWTAGLVTRTCVWMIVEHRAYPCLDHVELEAAPGDSGGPVFALNNDGTVNARGLLMAGDSAGQVVLVIPFWDMVNAVFDRFDGLQIIPASTPVE